MARTRVTPRKTTSVRPVELGRTDSFYSYRMGEQQSMVRFLNQFMQRWAAVRGLGVTELDGVIQLVQVLPPHWRAWAAEAALDFVHPDMEVRVTGNLVAFVNLLKKQSRQFGNPPPGLYFPLDQHQFILAVHQTLDDILAPREDTVELGTDEILDNESEPEECFDDEPPSSAVGTSTLQPLPIAEMQLSNNLSTSVPGDPGNSNTGSSSAAAEARKETSEGRIEVGDGDDDEAD